MRWLLLAGVLVISACDRRGDCLDDGGYWVEETDSCECTYEARGHYTKNPTEEQIAEQARCEQL